MTRDALETREALHVKREASESGNETPFTNDASRITSDERRATRHDARFQRLQAAYFERADEQKFLWQTSDAYLAPTERRLLTHVPIRLGDRVLEVGCGEGGNLQLLSVARPGTVGVDLSRPKVGWAGKTLGAGAFLCSDATALPFRDGSFDVVLCRDVLHHVRAKQEVVAELFRVCRPDGRLTVIEPNGRNPIMWLLGRVVPAERELLANSPGLVTRLIQQRQGCRAEVRLAQPFPVGRVLFHYRWGLPRLSAWCADAVLAIEEWVGRFIPADRWAYIIITAGKGGSTAPAKP